MTSGRLVVVSGTGTGIGKTHFSEALLLGLGRSGFRATGIKPVETGFDATVESDASRLTRASSFHVKHDGLRFADPVSPHIAARDAGTPISLPALAHEVALVRAAADVTVAELAGGLFSPLSETETNADLAALLGADLHILVAPDRLGVLHDLIAATRCAGQEGLAVHAIVLVCGVTPDSSAGRNAPEIRALVGVPLLGLVPRASVAEVARGPAVAAAVARAILSP
jgi:dethiobiotin synthetase